MELAEARAPWAIPWPCIHEFLAIVTHPKIFAPPTPLAHAIEQVEAWLESPTLVLLSESGDYWSELRGVIEAARVVGPRVHDARVAALCIQHGVRELWSADRDFGRIPRLHDQSANRANGGRVIRRAVETPGEEAPSGVIGDKA